MLYHHLLTNVFSYLHLLAYVSDDVYLYLNAHFVLSFYLSMRYKC